MTAISSTFNRPTNRGPGWRHDVHLLWRGIGVAMAVASIVLTSTLLEARGTRSGSQTGDGWPGIEDRRLPGGWEGGVPLDLLPLGVLPPETSS